MTIQIGFIGVGGLGYLQCRTFAEIEGVSIVGAADVTPGARDLFEDEFKSPAYEHYRTLLSEHADELDAVAIVTPHTLHYEQASAALRQGLHVLVEKPMVTDVGHAVDLVDTAEEQGVVLQVGYQRHFHPAFREIRRVIQSGRIGEVHTVNSFLGQDWIKAHRGTWRADPSLSGGGQLYDSGSHLLDALLWTTNSKPRFVSAEMEFDSPGLDVNSSLSMRLESDGVPLVGSVGVSGDGVEAEITEGYTYWGSEGRVSYNADNIEIAERDAVTYATELTQGTDFSTVNKSKIMNFVESIRGTKPPAVPGEVGLQVTALTEAAYLSTEEGRRIDVQALIDEARANRL